jgi:hypothetical protein
MFIERNNQKIKLAPEEMFKAYSIIKKKRIIDDIITSFESLFSDEGDCLDFREFFKDLNAKGYPDKKHINLYRELVDLSTEENINNIIKNHGKFLDIIYKTYNKDYNSKIDHDTQIKNAIFNTLRNGIVL